MIPKRFGTALAMSACLFALTGCLSEKGGDDITGGSVVENELGVGRLFFPDGQPAANAEVAVYSVNHVPGQAIAKSGALQELAAKVRTDSTGRYRLSGLPKGEYNLLANKNGLVAYEDSVFLTPDPVPLANDTLREPGELIGRVELQPNHDPRLATVQVLGTNVYSNVDDSGYFKLPNLGGGDYLLRVIVTGESGYTPLFQGVTARSGSVDTLPSPLRPIFTGIPVVTGIHTEYDTAKAIVTVTWNKSKFRNLAGYTVLKGLAGSLQPTRSVNTELITDTVLTDTLVNSIYSPSPLNSRVQYWVIAISKTDGEMGPYFESSTVEILPASLVATDITFECLGCNWKGWVTMKDTVRLVAHWKNAKRESKRISWFAQGSMDTLRTLAIQAAQGSDTLTWIAPEREFDYRIDFHVQDVKSDTWKASKTTSVLLDLPKIVDMPKLGPTTTGDTLAFNTKGLDVWGRIVEEGWDCRGKGKLLNSNGQTLFVIPAELEGFQCVYHVMDDDGNQVSDSVLIRVDPYTALNRFPEDGGSLITLGSSLLGVTPYGVIYQYQKPTDTWTQIAVDPGIGPIVNAPLAVDDTHLFLSYIPSATNSFLYFNLTTKTWLRPPPVPSGATPTTSSHSIVAGGGKVYFVPLTSRYSEIEIMEFDLGTQSWKTVTMVIPNEVGIFYANVAGDFNFMPTFGLNRLYVYTQSTNSKMKSCMNVYSPESASWSRTILPGTTSTIAPIFPSNGMICVPSSKSPQFWNGDFTILSYFDPDTETLNPSDTVGLSAYKFSVATNPNNFDFISGNSTSWDAFLWWHRGPLMQDLKLPYSRTDPFYNWIFFDGEYYLLSGEGGFAKFNGK